MQTQNECKKVALVVQQMRCTNCSGNVYPNHNGSNVGIWICGACGTQGQTLVQDSTRDKWLAEQYRVPQVAKDYTVYGLPGKVIDKAVSIYVDVVGADTLKRDNRKAMMCKCAYEAYNSMNLPHDPIMLAKKFGITVSKLRDAQKDFAERVFEKELTDKYPKKYITAEELLDEFLFFFGIEDAPKRDLEVVIQNIYTNLALQNRFRSRDVAICVVYWYMIKIGHIITTDQVRNQTDVAKATMTKILGIINKLSN